MSYEISILSIPPVTPLVNAIDYQIDSGPIVPIAGSVGSYPVGFVPPGTYSNRIRGRNAVGIGPWSDAKSKTVTWADIRNYYGITQAVIWDLDQIGTLWQDTAATAAITDYGQQVARVDDVSGLGNHLTQATLANRPTYARRPKSGIRNLLQRSEDFGNAFWTKTQSSVSGNFLFDNATDNQHFIFFAPANVAGQTETFTVWARPGTLGWMAILLDGVLTYFNLSTGALGSVGAGVTASMTLEPDGFYRCRITKTRVNASTTARIYVTNANNVNSYLGTGTGSIELQKSQFEISSNTTAYQKVVTTFDVTEAGQPDVNYLSFDGSNDCLQSTSTVNFSTTDEATVCVGARKLTDASQRSLLELGASVDANSGTFQLTAPNGASTSYAIRSRGTSTVTAEATGFAQPDMAILTGQIDISSDLLTLRRNGVQVATSSSDQGSGNFANATLFIGARNNASDRFLGHLNSGFVINKILDPAVLIAMEKWVASKAGIDL
jgi:hypothetical protein